MATKTTTRKTSTTNQTDLVKALESQIEGLQSDVHALMKAVSDKGESKMDQAAEAVSETTQKTADLANEEMEQIRTYIKKQPLKSVGLALGAGIAIALLSSRG
ncbi:ElaB/YqjD/DUF883 family membrane-anchored ribosome-binding protein [Maritalea mobilis]|uniref:ElaB/YqjD/DUF883 family membrane-anchored ribosome-binding protein n=1 Tax=Maritalea mobilis TaxID=483324 RepID=A0A4V3DBM0_9HYPH|nr:DUF883 family protein [Maritalea mobilis]TDQ67088.1 ElaB/YqjD/DUF883 family membrane-anchored ribosome-binding protein [Maritalea mobilis]